MITIGGLRPLLTRRKYRQREPERQATTQQEHDGTQHRSVLFARGKKRRSEERHTGNRGKHGAYILCSPIIVQRYTPAYHRILTRFVEHDKMSMMTTIHGAVHPSWLSLLSQVTTRSVTSCQRSPKRHDQADLSFARDAFMYVPTPTTPKAHTYTWKDSLQQGAWSYNKMNTLG